MSTGSRAACAIFFAAVALGQSRAEADDPGQQAVAETLFDEGRRLVQEGRFAEGCDKLAESQRLDPGIGTAFHLGDCYERIGRLASAWASFRYVAREAERLGQSDRSLVAKQRVEALEPRLLRLRLELRDPPAELMLTRDGQPISRAQLGVSVPVDPGTTELGASGPERVEWHRTVELSGEGREIVVDIELPAPPSDNELPAAPAETSSSFNQRHLALIAGGVGVVGIGFGIGFGAAAIGKKSDAEEHCPEPGACTRAGLDLWDEAQTNGNVSTATFVIGGAALAAGAVLWLTAPDDATIGVGVTGGQRHGSLTVRGRWQWAP